MSDTTLQILWYLVFAIVLCGYVVLDGFDLGVGALHLFARNDTERRIFLNAIGPVWDGNEVWLIVTAGALFAGFPFAYATICSAFYLIIMAILAGLIFRAVAIEIRSKVHTPAWRSVWDTTFCLASILLALAFGLLIGNLIEGLPLDETHEFRGTFSSLFSWYSILVAFMVLSLLALHGGIYLIMKTEGELHDRLRGWTVPLIAVFAILYVSATITTLIHRPHMAARFQEHFWPVLIALLNVLAVANIAIQIRRRKDGWAFVSSTVTILCFVTLYALGTYPYIVRSTINTAVNSLTISNSYASAKTLGILLIIVVIGVPLALTYTISIYYIFRGKVRLEETSY